MRPLVVMLAVALGLSGCFADGRELIAPDDPRYAELCVDSVSVDPDAVCRAPDATVTITIPNPLVRP